MTASNANAGGTASTKNMKYGSDLAAHLIRSLGIEYFVLNPGASYRGLHDSLLNYEAGDTARGNPEMIDCTQEGIAVAVAHGYAKASGRPLAVGLHNVVGLQAGSMAIFNAYSDRVPMLVFGGTGPTAIEARRPGIDWVHTALVQGNLVRDFTKWDDQPNSAASLVESIYRAARLATTEPQGPVYVCLDCGLQEGELEAIPEIPDPATMAQAPAPPAADPVALSRIADALRAARFPVILAGRVGRSEAGFAALSTLADRWGIAVIDHFDRLNVPTNHPMNLSQASKQALGRADVVLALDVKDLLGPISTVDRTLRTTVPVIPEGSRVFTIGLNEYSTRGWIADYQALVPAELNVLGDTATALPSLIELLGAPGEDVAARHQEIAEWHARLRAEAAAEPAKHADERPVALSYLVATLRDALKGSEFVLSTGNVLRGWVTNLLDLDQPRQFIGGSAGAGLGSGVGFTVGVSLAHRDTGKIVVGVQSDGDFMHTPGGLWTLAHHDLPALIVMNNNRSYYNSEEHQYTLAESRDRDEKRAGIGTIIDLPAIDYAMLAKSMGVEGIGPIDDPKDLPNALDRALSIIKNDRRPVLVDVITQPR